MSVKERLTTFVKSLNISKSEFCRQIGTSNAFISSIRVSIQQDKIQSIASKYPQLNISWLLTGEGEMLKQDKNSVQSPPVDYEKLPAGTGIIEFMMEQNRSLEKIVHDQNKIMLDNNELIKNLHARISELEAELDRTKNESTAQGKGAGCAVAS